MKLLSILLFLISVNAFSKQKFTPSTFEVIPLNSPVKESTAKFSLKLPTGFMIDKLKVKLVNAFELKKDQKKFEEVSVSNNQFSVTVSKLPPGFYRLYVTVIDHGTKREHEFKTNYHDYVRFVIDETMEVPMPDPKIDNATLGGVDKDNNQIPDRIQRYINETYANKPNIKMGLNQYAISKQIDLLSTGNKELSILATQKEFEAIGCLYWINGIRADKKTDELLARFLNTKERIDAELKASQNFHGKSESTQQQKLKVSEYFILCDFEASKED